MENTGTAVIVNRCIVAWFREFDEAARDWCTENYFGQWLTWQAKAPEMVMLSRDELAKIEKDAAELSAKFKAMDEAPD